MSPFRLPGRSPLRWTRVALVACLAVAVGVPGLWQLTRPDPSAGAPVTGTPVSGATAPPVTQAGEARSPAVRARAARQDQRAATPRPLRLQIPSIGVDAAVDAVGVRPDGSMVIPRKARRVGWYRFGPAPGSALGSAVIAGHVDARDQGPGALFRLRQIRVGATVSVTPQVGPALRYRVVGRQSIVKRRLPTEQLFARDGSPRLVLITCGGPFDRRLSSYRDNVVVVAEPVQVAEPGS